MIAAYIVIGYASLALIVFVVDTLLLRRESTPPERVRRGDWPE